jgi:hypothetical protein
VSRGVWLIQNEFNQMGEPGRVENWPAMRKTIDREVLSCRF